jgi:hypothetical protein
MLQQQVLPQMLLLLLVLIHHDEYWLNAVCTCRYKLLLHRWTQKY